MAVVVTDWNCPSCGNLNFASRQVCNIKHCSTPKPPDLPTDRIIRVSSTQPQLNQDSKLGDPLNWRCPQCNNENFPNRTHCNLKECSFPRPKTNSIRSQTNNIRLYNIDFGTSPSQPLVSPSQPPPVTQLGDPRNWRCPQCQNENFPSRTFCNRAGCQFPRPADPVPPVYYATLGDARNWNCPKCGNENFPNRTSCNRKDCAFPKPDFTPALSSATQGKLGDPHNWICPSCRNENFPARTHCNRANCNYPRPDLTPSRPRLDPPSKFQIRYETAPQAEMNDTIGGPNNWICVLCSNENFPARTRCNRCQGDKPKSIQPFQPMMVEPAGGNWVCHLCNNVNFPMRHQCYNKNCNAVRPSVAIMPSAGRTSIMPSAGRTSVMPSVGRTSVMSLKPMHSDRFVVPELRPGGTRSKPGDWICPSCNNHNYDTREVCNKCNKNKADVMNWICNECDHDNIPEHEFCNRRSCNASRPHNPVLVHSRMEIQGLKRSRPGDPDNWVCVCGNENFPGRLFCNIQACREPRYEQKRARMIDVAD